MTKQYSAAASQAGNAVEKTADLWTQGVRKVLDRTYLAPRLPQVDLIPAVERYFDFVQRAVDMNRVLTVKWVQAASTLSGTAREEAASAGNAVRERAESAGNAVRDKAGTVEQAAREQAAQAARGQAEKAAQAAHDLAREARKVEREQARRAHAKARERYQGMTKAELSDLLAKRKLPKSGNVDELIERLVEADGK